jgi:hypothetical protein
MTGRVLIFFFLVPIIGLTSVGFALRSGQLRGRGGYVLRRDEKPVLYWIGVCIAGTVSLVFLAGGIAVVIKSGGRIW